VRGTAQRLNNQSFAAHTSVVRTAAQFCTNGMLHKLRVCLVSESVVRVVSDTA